MVFASVPHGWLPTERRMFHFTIQDMVITYNIIMSTLTGLLVYESPLGEMICPSFVYVRKSTVDVDEGLFSDL